MEEIKETEARNPIQRIDEFGNTVGYGGNTLMAGEMTQNQEAPAGCSHYNDLANSPIFGSSSTKGLSKVVEQKAKVKHSVKSKKRE